MNKNWMIYSIIAVVVSIAVITFLNRRGRQYEAQVVATLLAAYCAVVLFSGATEANYILDPDVKVRGNLKTALLAISGGWLAQVLIALNKLANDPGKPGPVIPILLFCLLGAFCGLVAAALWSLGQGSFSSVTDQAAALAGIAGGAAGITVLDLVRKAHPVAGA